MKTNTRNCPACAEKTKHRNFGLVPASLFSYGPSEKWFAGMLCTECGALNRREATDNEESIARQRLMNALREIGLYEELYGDDSDSGVAPVTAGD